MKGYCLIIFDKFTFENPKSQFLWKPLMNGIRF